MESTTKKACRMLEEDAAADIFLVRVTKISEKKYLKDGIRHIIINDEDMVDDSKGERNMKGDNYMDYLMDEDGDNAILKAGEYADDYVLATYIPEGQSLWTLDPNDPWFDF